LKNLVVSAAVKEKLAKKHKVDLREVEQCFENKCGLYLEDDREDHQTDPVTLWFIAPTNKGRLLKVIFIFTEGNVHLKSVYEPEPEAIKLYDKDGH
jgi:uncharacterized DUF497 family protein